MGLIIGGAYAVSAALIVYGIERGYIARSDTFRYLIAWAIAGVFLALLTGWRSRGGGNGG